MELACLSCIPHYLLADAYFDDTRSHLHSYSCSESFLVSAELSYDKEAFDFRLTCFQRAAQRDQAPLGVTLTSDDLEDLVDILRPELLWPIRPRQLKLSPLLDILVVPEAVAVSHDRFVWRWFTLPLGWIEEGSPIKSTCLHLCTSQNNTNVCQESEDVAVVCPIVHPLRPTMMECHGLLGYMRCYSICSAEFVDMG